MTPTAPPGEQHLRAGGDDLFGLRGKTAVITGGTRGIGLMIARGLAEAGAEVLIVGRDHDAAAAAAEQLGGCGRFVAGDLSTESGVCDLAKRIVELDLGVSILVNNAGIVSRSPIAMTGGSQWDPVIDTNLKGPFYLIRELLPELESAAEPADPSRIINIGSIEGIRISGLPIFPYSSSKAALHHLTRALARDIGPRHITVNAIAPGTFPTEMSAPNIARRRAELEGETALGRLGRPDDIAGAVRFLASRAGSFVTGAILPVDGGASLRW